MIVFALFRYSGAAPVAEGPPRAGAEAGAEYF